MGRKVTPVADLKRQGGMRDKPNTSGRKGGSPRRGIAFKRVKQLERGVKIRV